jgi:hypothetical protein
MENPMKKIAAISASATTLLVSAPQAFAQNLGIPQPEGFKINDLGLFISRALTYALAIAGILVFIYLVWGGIQWITSGGDKSKTEEARSRITAALVGLAIVATAWAVIQLVSYFFGIDLLFGEGFKPPTAF